MSAIAKSFKFGGFERILESEQTEYPIRETILINYAFGERQSENDSGDRLARPDFPPSRHFTRLACLKACPPIIVFFTLPIALSSSKQDAT